MSTAKTKTRMKAAAADAPHSREDAEALLAAIGADQRAVTRITADLNDAINAAKDAATKQAAPYNARIQANFRALHVWAQAHRDSLCPRNRKTARLATGEISWRQRPPSVRITGKDKVIAALKNLGLTRFLRARTDVDKDAILADPDAAKGVKGLSIVSGVEDFVAKPFETEIERAEPVRKGGAR